MGKRGRICRRHDRGPPVLKFILLLCTPRVWAFHISCACKRSPIEMARDPHASPSTRPNCSKRYKFVPKKTTARPLEPSVRKSAGRHSSIRSPRSSRTTPHVGHSDRCNGGGIAVLRTLLSDGATLVSICPKACSSSSGSTSAGFRAVVVISSPRSCGTGMVCPGGNCSWRKTT